MAHQDLKENSGTGATEVVRALKEHGVTDIFGLPGLQLDHIFDALYDEQGSVRVIHTRHEQATAYMAFGYAQASGKVGTSLVVPGAGVLNTMGALSTAHACNSPVLSLTGQIPSPYIGQGLGFLHEIPNQLGALASVTKWQGHIGSPEGVADVMDEAFYQLNSGRRRPVAVEIPMDITARSVAGPRVSAVKRARSTSMLDDDAVTAAAKLLANAKNPAIFVGGGIWGSEEALLTLAEALQAPVFMTPHALGAVSWRHPLAQTLQVGNDIWPTIDAALAVGTRFFNQIVDWGHDDHVKLIRVDVDSQQSVTPWKPDVHIVTDADIALRALVDAIEPLNLARPSRHDEFANLKAAKEQALGEIFKPQRDFARTIRAATPDETIFCFDVTQMHFYSWWAFPAYFPRSIIQPGYQGTLGYGYPTALGAKVAYPERPVVYIGGDGGFMFNCQELSTAMAFGINVVAIIFNDSAFGNVRRIQKEQFSGRYISSELYNPDFIKFAESFGMRSMRTDSPAGLAQLLPAALAADEPVLIEVKVGPMPNPHPIFMRKVRGLNR
jgi:acetolactate synthase-1/2/3 large subunit